MSNALEEFASSLDLDASRALNSPALIFLCGGALAHPSDVNVSLRSLFFHRLKNEYPELRKRVLLAEDANAWAKVDRQYLNLLDLESDLACLSAVILLFVESAGSIAELGAFCKIDVLRDKLVAILEYSHDADQSFIRDGPVALLQQHDKKSVLFLPWLGSADEHGRRRVDETKAQDTINHILDSSSAKMKASKRIKSFCRGDAGHRQLLVADFIALGTIVRHGEIRSFIKGLELSIPTRKLNQYLFLLEKLKIIDSTQFGTTRYYLAGSEGAEYVDYALKSAKVVDRLRLKSDLSAALPKDVYRLKAYDAFQEKSGS
jgi:hypothetical protein